MSDTTDILAKLAAPLPADAVDWRVGSTTADKKRGMALAYIDARTVQDRLTEVCGHLWQCDHTVSVDGKKVTCRIAVKFGDEWIWRSDGAGETDFEGEKGSYSDAFKRAAVKWGIGRYLYDMGAPWVELEAGGKKIAAHELPKLLALAGGKPAGRPAAAAPKPQPSAAPPADAVAKFWAGKSYEIACDDLLVFATKIEKAVAAAPTADALLKLETDNATDLAALNNQAPTAWKQVQTVLSAARKKLNPMAA